MRDGDKRSFVTLQRLFQGDRLERARRELGGDLPTRLAECHTVRGAARVSSERLVEGAVRRGASLLDLEETPDQLRGGSGDRRESRSRSGRLRLLVRVAAKRFRSARMERGDGARQREAEGEHRRGEICARKKRARSRREGTVERGDLEARAREDSRGNRHPIVVCIARGRLHGGHRAASSRVADEAPRVPSRIFRLAGVTNSLDS